VGAADISQTTREIVMTDRGRDDPTLLLLIGVAVAGLLGWRLLSDVDSHSLADAISSLRGPLVGLTSLLAALALARAVATRRALRRRVRLAVVPADEFDPSPDAVVRFAAQLARVRRSVRGWVDRRARAVRVRLELSADGRLIYLLEVPGDSEELLRSALRGYEGIELRAPGELAAGAPANGDRRAARAELVLARPSVEALARLSLDPDPLAAFAAALRPLRPEVGDRAVVCVDLLPTSGLERRRVRRRLLGEARRLHRRDSAGRGPLGRDRRHDPVDSLERRELGRALDAKLKDAGAVFRLQLLVRCESADRGRATVALRSLVAGFEQLADRNWLRVAGLPLPGLGFLGSDVPLRRRWFDHRLDTGLFRPARRGVVTARELAGFLKPPTAHCSVDEVVRSGALVPAPPPLPSFDGQAELIPLGRVADEAGERLAAVRVEDTFFSYVAGRSRFGKTELAICQFLQLVRSGHGGLFLDPHEDAIVRIRSHLTDPGVRDRVIEIDLAGRAASERQPAWNLFELAARDPAQAEAKVEAVVDAFASALRWDERNARALNLTTQAAAALAAIARELPPGLCPTIFQLPTLLSDEDWRRACLPFLPRASQRFWLDRFPRLSEEAITPVTNLIDRLRASTPITALLGQSESSYRIREAMDRGLIVLACPGSGGTRDRLVANLLVFDLLHAAKGRAELAPERRRPFWVFLDEVQTYDGASSGNLAALLEQTAKYGVRAFLLNQNPERLTPATLNAVTTNRSHLIATALNARAAGLIAKEWAGRPDPGALVKLPRYRFLCQVTHRGAVSKPFALRGVAVEELLGPGRPDQVAILERTVDARAGRRPVREALAHLETLDERIAEALRRRHREDARRERGVDDAAPKRRPAPTGRRRIVTEEGR
jgi:hypothetical protein